VLIKPSLFGARSVDDEITIPEYRRAEYARQEVLKEPILPSGVAEVILLLVGDAMRHITGRVIPVDNGAYPR
jgi:3-oxoacyl-[acyl-carrier protein] reductase